MGVYKDSNILFHPHPKKDSNSYFLGISEWDVERFKYAFSLTSNREFPARNIVAKNKIGPFAQVAAKRGYSVYVRRGSGEGEEGVRR